MLRDAQGLAVTTDSVQTIAAIDQFVDQSLSYGNHPEVILQAIAADPACAIAYAYAASYYLSLESATGRRQAQRLLQAALQYQAQTNEREQLYIQATVAWKSGEINWAIALYEEITQKFPRDIMAVQQGQYHYFYQGNEHGLVQIATKVFAANRENHYLHGMLAFGLEQCQHLEEAEALGRQATTMHRHDPWAHHAVAHVMETQGRIDEGIAWMESLADTWENCNSMLFTHNWWHVALYYLEQEAMTQVLELYDTHVWGRAWQQSPKDQVGAISLLLRLELRGVDVGNRWQTLATYLTPRIHEHSLPFQDLHYIYALARAGEVELVTEMCLSMQDYAKKVKPCLQEAWVEITVPAARGMIAHATGDWEGAIAFLRQVLPQLHCIGGSHAQRDVFEQVYLDAWLRAEQNYQALDLLQKRITSRRYVPSLQRGSMLQMQAS